jgi:hypothetical protein
MSDDLEALQKELQSLLQERKVEAEALRRAQHRGSGRGPYAASQKSFAASLAADFEKHDKQRDQRIAEIQAKIEKLRGGGQQS